MYVCIASTMINAKCERTVCTLHICSAQKSLRAPAVRIFCVHISHNNSRIAHSIAVVNEYRMFNIHAGLISYDCTEDNGDNNSSDGGDNDKSDEDDCDCHCHCGCGDDDDDCEGAF